MINGNIDWTWIINGNNVSLSSELADRAVLIRITSGKSRPELRTDFKNLDLKAWVKAHRAGLVRACLILIQHWIAQGAPRDPTFRLGGFDSWAQTTHGILSCAGIEGFLSNRVDLDADGTNTERDALTLFLTAWDSMYGEMPVPVGDPESSDLGTGLCPGPGGLLALLAVHEIELPDLDLTKGKRSQQTNLANWLFAHKDGPHEIVRYRNGERQEACVSIKRVAERGTGRPRWVCKRLQNGPWVKDADGA
jgi:hypothetical protein